MSSAIEVLKDKLSKTGLKWERDAYKEALLALEQKEKIIIFCLDKEKDIENTILEYNLKIKTAHDNFVISRDKNFLKEQINSKENKRAWTGRKEAYKSIRKFINEFEGEVKKMSNFIPITNKEEWIRARNIAIEEGKKQGALEELNKCWDLIGVVDKNGIQIELINYIDKRIKKLGCE